MHDGRVVFSCEKVPGAADIGRQLVHGIDALHRLADKIGIPQVSQKELIRGRPFIIVFLEVHAAHPEAFSL